MLWLSPRQQLSCRWILLGVCGVNTLPTTYKSGKVTPWSRFFFSRGWKIRILVGCVKILHKYLLASDSMWPLQGCPRRPPGEIEFIYETFNTYRVISAYISPKAEGRWYTGGLWMSHCSHFKDTSTHLICKLLDSGDTEESGFWREALGMHGTYKTLTWSTALAPYIK